MNRCASIKHPANALLAAVVLTVGLLCISPQTEVKAAPTRSPQVQPGKERTTKQQKLDAALLGAMYDENIAKVQAALAKGASANAREETHPHQRALHIAVSRGLPLVKLLLAHGARYDVRDDEGNTPLNRAVGGGDSKVALELIAKGANITARNWEGTGPLEQANARGEKTIKRALLNRLRVLADKGVRLQRKDLDLGLALAATVGDSAAAKHLVARGANVNATVDGDGPLLTAVENHHLEIVQFLTDKGASVNIRGNAEATPLMLAASHGSLPMVKLLLAKGANAKATGPGGDSALSNALSRENIFNDVVQELFTILETNKSSGSPSPAASHASPEESDDDNTIDAGPTDVVGVVKELLRHGVSVQNTTGSQALIVAAASGHTTLVQLLLTQGVKADVRDEDAKTPLMGVAGGGRRALPEIFKALSLNAYTLEMDEAQKTAFSKWSTEGDSAIVETLIAKGADINARDLNFNRPLMTAAATGNATVTRILIAKGATLNISDLYGRTALKLAKLNRHDDVAQMLVEAGAIE